MSTLLNRQILTGLIFNFEKAWAYLKSVVVHKAPKTEQTFYTTMQKAWKELDSTVLKRVVLELPDVMVPSL
jgi:hypothetical protein